MRWNRKERRKERSGSGAGLKGGVEGGKGQGKGEARGGGWAWYLGKSGGLPLAAGLTSQAQPVCSSLAQTQKNLMPLEGHVFLGLTINLRAQNFHPREWM